MNAELMITREDRSNKKNEIGNIPLKIKLLMETNNLGKVSVEINNLKKDLQINLSLENEKIKNLFKEKVYLLENNLKELPFEVKEIQCNINRKQNDNNSILLPQKYKVMSMKRIDGVM
jgi:translation elongation factor EF-1beta